MISVQCIAKRLRLEYVTAGPLRNEWSPEEIAGDPSSDQGGNVRRGRPIGGHS